MYMNIEYDKPLVGKKMKSIYTREEEAVMAFASSEHTNMRLEYRDDKQANNAYGAILKIIKKTRTPVTVSRRQKYIYVFKKGEQEDA